jgi:hypothetical protein
MPITFHEEFGRHILRVVGTRSRVAVDQFELDPSAGFFPHDASQERTTRTTARDKWHLVIIAGELRPGGADYECAHLDLLSGTKPPVRIFRAFRGH